MPFSFHGSNVAGFHCFRFGMFVATVTYSTPMLIWAPLLLLSKQSGRISLNNHPLGHDDTHLTFAINLIAFHPFVNLRLQCCNTTSAVGKGVSASHAADA